MTLPQRAYSIFRRITPHGYWVVTLLAGFLRFYNLGYPKSLVFDETYYVKDAWTLWKHGFETNWPTNPNAAFEAGHVNTYLSSGSFIVHPPLGKWLIALPMALFGPENSWTWRYTTAIFGTAAVLLLMLVAKKLSGSQSFAILAGLLFAIDGHAIVLSRIALLDGILMFFALLAFYFLLLDREKTRVRYQVMAVRGRASVIWNRPWLVACALALGAATSVKWSGAYFALFFGAYVVVSEALYLRRNRIAGWQWAGARQALADVALMLPAYALVYLASWTGWILAAGGYDRTSSPNWLQALINYHQAIYNFHVNLHIPHPYASNPLTWLLLGRPVAFYYVSQPCPQLPYGCSSAIDAVGNPLIWWGALAAVLYLTWRYLRHGNRTDGLVLLGIAAGYLPWLAYMNRTVFQFYAIAFEPYLILGLVLVIRGLWYSKPGGATRRLLMWYFMAVAATSVFFLSLWWGFTTPYLFWIAHMWLGPLWI